MKTMITGIILILINLQAMGQREFKKEWKTVDSLRELGLPASALEEVMKIYHQGKENQIHEQYIKSLIYKMELEEEYQEDSREKAIAFVQEELKDAMTPVRQILCSILAQMYWDYYLDNQWTINSRTPVSGNSSMDVSTWDARRFVEICTDYFLQSLSEDLALKFTPLSHFGEILEGDKNTRKFRPALYDLLAFRAIDFFSEENPGLIKPADTFSLNDRKYFAPAGEFIQEALETGHRMSFEYLALKLYQEVIRFHAVEIPDREALADADLARLAFVYKKSTLPGRELLYEKALRRLAREYDQETVYAEISYHLALHLKMEGARYRPLESEDHKWQIKEARETAAEGAGRFPGSFGANNCQTLIKEIDLPSLEVTGNGAVIPGKPSLLLVKYRNSPSAWIRVIKSDPEDYQEEEKGREKRSFKDCYSLPALHEWRVDLPSDGDYQLHSAEVKIPPLAPGYYRVLISDKPGYEENAQISRWGMWSTYISVISKRQEDGSLELFFLDREKGNPLSGIQVTEYHRSYSYSQRNWIGQPGRKFKTDTNGFVRILPESKANSDRFYFLAALPGDTFITENYFYYSREEGEPASEIRTFLFTDRAIYRPGQTVYFKGIVLERSGDRQGVKTAFPTTVSLRDVNDQLVASSEKVTNEYGSFSGIFIIPEGGLTGSMTLTDGHGVQSIRVEEYKRPSFALEFEPLAGAYQLDQEVKVKGKAATYAGSNVSGATITYRVVRNARFPYFGQRWFDWKPVSPEMEIKSGTVQTGSNGDFEITFDAASDASVPLRYSPVFTFTLHIRATDINGETQSAQLPVQVGYDALLVSANLEDHVSSAIPPDLKVSVTNMNGQPEKAEGTVMITRLAEPKQPLFPRKWSRPDKFTMSRDEFSKSFPGAVYNAEDQPENWKAEGNVYAASFETPGGPVLPKVKKLTPGMYLLVVNTNDCFGKAIVYKKYFRVFSPVPGRANPVSPAFVTLLKPEVQPGETAPVIIGSPLRDVFVIVETASKSNPGEHRFLKISNSQERIDFPVTEEHRGNMAVQVLFVKNNHLFREKILVKVPYTNKELDIRVASFRDKVEPGQQEEWQVTILDKSHQEVMAELLAGMYDASLDIFTGHSWPFFLYHDFPGSGPWNPDQGFRTLHGTQQPVSREMGDLALKTYETMIWFHPDYYIHPFLKSARSAVGGSPLRSMAATDIMISRNTKSDEEETTLADDADALIQEEASPGTGTREDARGENPLLPPSKPRKIFNETAFFFPQLATNERGETIIRFKMPESLTRWRFMGMAHTKDLKTGKVEKTMVTRKDLMVFPNAPRFLREGDKMEFPARISNVGDHTMQGRAELHFFDAETMIPLNDLMNPGTVSREFTAGVGENALVSWSISVPEGVQAVVYRIIATAGSFSDGEEAPLPVLPNRMMVTESMPMPVRGKTTKSFSFSKLSDAGSQSSTLRNYRLTLEFTSNPAWYAVQALPYLMEFPHECAEQVFSRFYANSLAQTIANSDPRIKEVFEEWKKLPADALKSNLEKNEELKSVLLHESPWVRDAAGEKERKQKTALLFDQNRMASEQNKALEKLTELQSPAGGWPWFPGMPESEYITQHVVAGMGHLVALKVISPENNAHLFALLEKAIKFLDREKLEEFERLKQNTKDYAGNNHLNYEMIHFFYARSFFSLQFPFGEEMKELVSFYTSQALRYWKENNNYMKAMTALFLERSGDHKTAALILRSLAETALHDEETGMYWKNNRKGWFWHEAPVETQALLIEAFDEIAGDAVSVEEMKVWLLKQKQTNDWKSTKATAGAIYALLMRGSSLLSDDKPVSIRAGGEEVNPYLDKGTKPEPGTGYFKTSWEDGQITPGMGNVQVSNPHSGITWGALYWQYFEQIDKITPASTPLSVEKELYAEKNSPQGPVLEKITGERPVKTGEKVVVRVILKADRDMEYIHLKDMRAPSFEPETTLSGYRWQGGLGYYESIRDASANFFIDYLPGGTYIFEYRLHATRKGDFSTGITSVQCMYAPEFGAHSGGTRITVE